MVDRPSGSGRDGGGGGGGRGCFEPFDGTQHSLSFDSRFATHLSAPAGLHHLVVLVQVSEAQWQPAGCSRYHAYLSMVKSKIKFWFII